MASDIEAIELAEMPFESDYATAPKEITSACSLTLSSIPQVTSLEDLVDSPCVYIEAPGIEGLVGGGVGVTASEFVTLVAGEGCGIQLYDEEDATGTVTVEFPSDGMLTIRSQDYNQMILMEAAGIQILTPETITMTTGECSVELNDATGFDVDCFGISNLLLDEAGAQLQCYSSYALVSEVLIEMVSTSISMEGTIEITGETAITGNTNITGELEVTGATTITGGLIVA
ncbi:hypothetical protein Pan216_10670 [Planctomycetes bacterium Pan216]|uniref:Uncharacterized protein n=1 Tax=Kolteria novifilia TaxID=2527975 RepID=A0A518AZR0_9BACT|nr:hypothetical protein Pan216_10670 [Planctomycetes bacterium Pan216]